MNKRKESMHLTKFVSVVLLAAVPLFAQQGSEADRLAAAERAFSEYTAMNGIREGFIEYFDDQSVVFRPFAVNGKKWYTNHLPIKGVLSWRPTYVLVSSSGDMGISTGPWEFRNLTLNEEPNGYGHYFSVWKKDQHGVWKVILDTGNSYSKEDRKDEREAFIVSTSRSRRSTRQESNVLQQVEALMAREARGHGLMQAVNNLAADDLRVYRDRHFPTKTKASSLSLLSEDNNTYTLKVNKIVTASSGDLAYSYGIAVSAAKDTSTFVHIWKQGNGWKLAADLLTRVRR